MSSENKGADQLRGYREADLHLCFSLCKLLVFPWGGSNIFHPCAWDRLSYFTGSSFQLYFSAVVFGGDLATQLSALFKRKCTRYLRTER